MKGRLCLIAAAGEGNGLGKDNSLVWHLPDDFRRFRKLTTGHPIIMGRKTFESFPKPLPDRKHIIVTRNRNYSVPYADCLVVHSLEAALEEVEEEKLAFVIGGGELYRQTLPYADCIELTRVHGHFDADTYFPKLEADKWELLKEVFHPADEKHAQSFTYLTYKRKQEPAGPEH